MQYYASRNDLFEEASVGESIRDLGDLLAPPPLSFLGWRTPYTTKQVDPQNGVEMALVRPAMLPPSLLCQSCVGGEGAAGDLWVKTFWLLIVA
jgi:hypothetical protein